MSIIRKIFVSLVWAVVFLTGTGVGYFVMMFFLVFVPGASAPVRSLVGDGYKTVLWVLPATAYFAGGLAFVCGLLGLLPFTRLRLSENQGIPLRRRLVPLFAVVLAVPMFAWLAVGPLHGFVVRRVMLDFWVADINRSLPEPVSGRRLMKASKKGDAIVFRYLLGDRLAATFEAKPKAARLAMLESLATHDISFLLSNEKVPLVCIYSTSDGKEVVRHRFEPREWPESSREP